MRDEGSASSRPSGGGAPWSTIHPRAAPVRLHSRTAIGPATPVPTYHPSCWASNCCMSACMQGMQLTHGEAGAGRVSWPTHGRDARSRRRRLGPLSGLRCRSQRPAACPASRLARAALLPTHGPAADSQQPPKVVERGEGGGGIRPGGARCNCNGTAQAGRDRQGIRESGTNGGGMGWGRVGEDRQQAPAARLCRVEQCARQCGRTGGE